MIYMYRSISIYMYRSLDCAEDRVARSLEHAPPPPPSMAHMPATGPDGGGGLGPGGRLGGPDVDFSVAGVMASMGGGVPPDAGGAMSEG